MNALPLFDHAESVRRRDAGMQLAASHSPEFSEIAHAALIRIARRQLTVFTDDLTAELAITGARPNHPNAFGAVWTRAVREKLIQRTNQTRKSSHTLKRAHNYPIYLSLLFDPRSAS